LANPFPLFFSLKVPFPDKYPPPLLFFFLPSVIPTGDKSGFTPTTKTFLMISPGGWNPSSFYGKDFLLRCSPLPFGLFSNRLDPPSLDFFNEEPESSLFFFLGLASPFFEWPYIPPPTLCVVFLRFNSPDRSPQCPS